MKKKAEKNETPKQAKTQKKLKDFKTWLNEFIAANNNQKPCTADGLTLFDIAGLVSAALDEKETGAASGNGAGELSKVVDKLGAIADKLEAIRKTLWRMSEIREYKSVKGAADGSNGSTVPEARTGAASETATTETKGE